LRKENERAYARLEKLAERASLHQVNLNVINYMKAADEQKPSLAHKIKRESKLSHRFILDLARAEGRPPESLWKAIHSDAKLESDRLFRQGLSAEGKLAFDTIKSLKGLQQEIRASWQSDLSEARKEGVYQTPNPKTQQLFALRNKLAEQAINTPALMDVVSYFKIDKDVLKKQSTQHHARETVQQFVKSTSNFKGRIKQALIIKEDIKRHYPFIAEANFDAKILSKYLRVVEREERLSTLSDDESREYKIVLQYKMATYRARIDWKAHYRQSGDLRQSNNRLAQSAIIQTARRDALASSLKQSPFLEKHLNLERIKPNSLSEHAETHLTKCKQVASLSELAYKLMGQYENIEHQKTDKIIDAWKDNWSGTAHQLAQIKQDLAFIEALKGHEPLIKKAHAFDAQIKEKYQLKELAHPKQYVNRTLEKLQQSRSYLDAKTVNEALMTNPENTYIAVFGEPKSINSREIRFSGGLIVTLKGPKKGLWYDFNEGKGGMPIDAIMASRQLDFKEALKVAADLSGLTFNQIPLSQTPPIHRDRSNNDEGLAKKNGQVSAKSIWEGSVPIKGTLAETYLQKHRGIEDPSRLNVRFWPIGAAWVNCKEDGTLEDKINKIPALIIPAKNINNQISGVQRIYLDKNSGGKNRFMDNPKLSKGTIEGSAAILQEGMKGARVFIAEGPETAASIATCFPGSVENFIKG
jgi:hypothetical protein